MLNGIQCVALIGLWLGLSGMTMAYAQEKEPYSPTILIVYYSDSGNTESLAQSVYQGASEGQLARVILKPLGEATNEDVLVADAILLGSPVYNANPAPEVLSFIQGWPFQNEPLRDKIGAVFVTGGGISSGEELVQNALQNAMLIFGMVVVGGGDWTTAFGASAITYELKDYDKAEALFTAKGVQLGRRVRDAVLRWNAK